MSYPQPLSSKALGVAVTSPDLIHQFDRTWPEQNWYIAGATSDVFVHTYNANGNYTFVRTVPAARAAVPNVSGVPVFPSWAPTGNPKVTMNGGIVVADADRLITPEQADQLVKEITRDIPGTTATWTVDGAYSYPGDEPRRVITMSVTNAGRAVNYDAGRELLYKRNTLMGVGCPVVWSFDASGMLQVAVGDLSIYNADPALGSLPMPMAPLLPGERLDKSGNPMDPNPWVYFDAPQGIGGWSGDTALLQYISGKLDKVMAWFRIS